MTATEKIVKADHWRVGSNATAGWNGVFVVPADGDLWQVILSDDGGWRHLVANNFYRNQRASHNVIKTLRNYFFGDEAWVVEYYPPLGALIGGYTSALHLWESIDVEMPVPLDHREKSMLTETIGQKSMLTNETNAPTSAEPQAGQAEPPVPPAS